MHDFPIQLAKVRRPALPRETLRRDRLIDWLRAKVHNRVVLVTAEAGYGKTTVVADFARHSRRPMMWYRLDTEDRNWVSFLHYLVAAGREVEPGFGPATKELLDQLGASAGPGRETILATFLRELHSLAETGATLIIDDYHLVDDVPDVRSLVRELIARAPERLSLVFISRRAPTLPLSRLRSVGEVAELGTADLRFDLAETGRLFSETYGRPLDGDVLADLAARTEGWAASLQMVNTALRGRSTAEVRAFVRGLTGAHGDLYDYLAEEVVGDLDDDMQQFLMRTALLQAVDPALTEVVVGLAQSRARELIASAERLGLLSGRGRSGEQGRRYHPLVRAFLATRLERALGDEAVRDLHRAVARYAGVTDWRLAAYHYAAAEDDADLGLVVQAAVPTIMGGGEFALAESYLQRVGPADNAAFELLTSRMELHRGHIDRSVAHAEAAVDVAMRSQPAGLADQALANLVTVLFAAGRLEEAREVAEVLATRKPARVLLDIAHGVQDVIDGSLAGDLEAIEVRFADMVRDQEARGLRHYAGITWINLAEIRRNRGQVDGALEAATRALDELAASSAGFEMDSARVLRGWALLHQGRVVEAEGEFSAAASSPFEIVRAETLTEIADAHAQLGDRRTSELLVSRAVSINPVAEATRDQINLVSACLAGRRGDLADAQAVLSGIAIDRPSPIPTFATRVLVTRASLAALAGSPDAGRFASAALHAAAAQRAKPAAEAARLLQAIADGSQWASAAVVSAAAEDPTTLSILAEVVCRQLGWLESEAISRVTSEAERRPARWREPLRAALLASDAATRYSAAAILDRMGGREDVAVLRAVSRSLTSRTGGARIGRGLARRLAPHVHVHDLGRVEIAIGGEITPGTSIRRKVLAAMCFLLSCPRMAATRDKVLDALWPEFEPNVAMNSLNQTIYFLRRVFEPAFSEDTSPGYVHHDTDVIWLDPELVGSASTEVRAAIRRAEFDASPENVEAVSRIYTGRFALDFTYEEWAVPYRDSLHAAYLEVIEKAVLADMRSGAFDRAIGLARRAIEIDPDAEQVELSLLRLYGRTGAHAAAAEQYEHYAEVLRNDLGIEPPPLDSLWG